MDLPIPRLGILAGRRSTSWTSLFSVWAFWLAGVVFRGPSYTSSGRPVDHLDAGIGSGVLFDASLVRHFDAGIGSGVLCDASRVPHVDAGTAFGSSSEVNLGLA